MCKMNLDYKARSNLMQGLTILHRNYYDLLYLGMMPLLDRLFPINQNNDSLVERAVHAEELARIKYLADDCFLNALAYDAVETGPLRIGNPPPNFSFIVGKGYFAIKDLKIPKYRIDNQHA